MAVQGVWSEPVSAEFPVKQGKNREFYQNWGILSVSISRTVLELRQFLSDFPTHKNREIKSLNREIFRVNREILLDIREPITLSGELRANELSKRNSPLRLPTLHPASS
jgi:hypothetical protein